MTTFHHPAASRRPPNRRLYPRRPRRSGLVRRRASLRPHCRRDRDLTKQTSICGAVRQTWVCTVEQRKKKFQEETDSTFTAADSVSLCGSYY
eukprot:1518191-Pleurochrysis_carterae.AAC.3